MAYKNSKPLPVTDPAAEDQDSENNASRTSIREGEWLIQIKEGIHAQCSLARPPTVSIFSVPRILVDLKRDAYLPQAVSIGPCFHRHTHLADMDTHKLRALQKMVNRLDRGSDINFVLKEVGKMEGEIRDSYEKVIDCNSETLVRMMVLDASFLLELFRTLTGAKDNSPSDSAYFEPIFDENRIQSVGFAVLADIVKLENQIPLFVLAKMIETQAPSEQDPYEILYHLVVKAAASFFPFKFCQRDHWSHFELDSLSVGRKHFLGLLHGLILSFISGAPHKTGSERPSYSRNLWNHVLPSVSRLCKGGIRMKPYNGEGRMALRFDKETSILFVPVIMISENTETVLRNLMALEAFLPVEMQMISCYVGLMNSLIYTENDVTLMRREGLLHIYVGNDAQVAQLWGNLCKGMAISSNQPLRSIKKEIMECYRSKFRARFVEFVINYFRGPWRTAISLVAATFIFLFTLGQTMSSMYGFSKASP